jgi:pyridoxamine 5'-phosphate oxidase
MSKDSVHQNAIAQLNNYLSEAKTFGDENANCCYLATSSQDLQPTVRVITIYDINSHGLLFLAKKSSGKIIHLANNPKAGLCFHWKTINVQATIEGIVEEISKEESEALWNKRDRDASIAAWASDIAKTDGKQVNSMTLSTAEAKQRFQGNRPPLAESWSGYVLKPNRIEFWPTSWKKNQAHTCYSKKGGFWHESSFH